MIILAAVVACTVAATALHRWWASRADRLNRSADACCSLMHDIYDDATRPGGLVDASDWTCPEDTIYDQEDHRA